MSILVGKEHWLPAAEAARKADTDIHYLHKLIKQGLQADYIQTGKIKKWFINPDCPRYQKLLNRKAPVCPNPFEPQEVTSPDYPFDGVLWEDMLRAGEEIVRDRCSGATIREYKRYSKNFYKKYSVLNRDNLRAALKEYEAKETEERDYFTSRRMLHQALMSVARFLVFKGDETPAFVRGLELLRPKPGKTKVSRPCHKEDVIYAAIDKFGTAKNKRGVRAYRYYDELLNKTLVALAYYTAARSSELCNIKLSHVDFKKGSIRLYGKGNKERVVGICPRLRSALISYRQERPTTNSPYLLLSAKGRPLTKDAISRRYQRLRKYLGVSDFKPHTVRASAITDWLNEKQVPMSIVRDAVGHSNLSVTSLYARPTENDVIEAMKTRL